MSFDLVLQFEEQIAKFYGSKYAVATDCCTHAIELCLRYQKNTHAHCPKHSYISIPFTFEKLNLNWQFVDNKWRNYYYVTDKIIDAAVYWQEKGYIPNTYMCLSFQFQKHLSLGRGGAILVDKKHDYDKLKKMSYDGRIPNVKWAEQDISSIGYHYYMTPETAKLGLDKLPDAIEKNAKKWDYKHYPNLTKMSVFQLLRNF